MILIVGLGNPGRKYAGSRHNTGFLVLDGFAEKCGIRIRKREKGALCGRGVLMGEQILLAKPQTFMNASGGSVAALTAFYGIDPKSGLIVVYDDIDLQPGVLRIRAQGSAGGHKGMLDIIAALGTDHFPRVRVGVGAKPPGRDLADYVLSRPPKEERVLIEDAARRAADALLLMVEGRVDAAMNLYNGA